MMSRCVILGAGVLLLLAACARKPAPERPFEALAGHGYFVKYLKPVLETRCLNCHRGADAPAGLSLVQRSALHAPRKNARPFVVPGDPGASLLYGAVSSPAGHPRVSSGPLLDEWETAIVYEWIEDGAFWPDAPDGFLRPRVLVPRKMGLLDR
jgi:hypothetical protein